MIAALWHGRAEHVLRWIGLLVQLQVHPRDRDLRGAHLGRKDMTFPGTDRRPLQCERQIALGRKRVHPHFVNIAPDVSAALHPLRKRMDTGCFQGVGMTLFRKKVHAVRHVEIRIGHQHGKIWNLQGSAIRIPQTNPRDDVRADPPVVDGEIVMPAHICHHGMDFRSFRSPIRSVGSGTIRNRVRPVRSRTHPDSRGGEIRLRIFLIGMRVLRPVAQRIEARAEHPMLLTGNDRQTAGKAILRVAITPGEFQRRFAFFGKQQRREVAFQAACDGIGEQAARIDGEMVPDLLELCPLNLICQG